MTEPVTAPRPEPVTSASLPPVSAVPTAAATDGPPPAPPAPTAADPTVQAALAAVEAARAGLAEQLVTLEASTRAALDVKAKIKRNPGKTAAAVGGTAFVVVGGPRRVFRAVKHRIVGKPDPLPPSLLPDQVETAVRALGDDGAKVRGALEREFAAYVAEGRRQDMRFTRRLVLATAAPLATTALREVVKRLAAAPPEDVERRADEVRARVDRKRTPGS